MTRTGTTAENREIRPKTPPGAIINKKYSDRYQNHLDTRSVSAQRKSRAVSERRRIKSGIRSTENHERSPSTEKEGGIRTQKNHDRYQNVTVIARGLRERPLTPAPSRAAPIPFLCKRILHAIGGAKQGEKPHASSCDLPRSQRRCSQIKLPRDPHLRKTPPRAVSGTQSRYSDTGRYPAVSETRPVSETENETRRVYCSLVIVYIVSINK